MRQKVLKVQVISLVLDSAISQTRLIRGVGRKVFVQKSCSNRVIRLTHILDKEYRFPIDERSPILSTLFDLVHCHSYSYDTCIHSASFSRICTPAKSRGIKIQEEY